MKFEITKAQISAIVSAADNLSSMRGGMDYETEKEFDHIIKMIDRFLKNNGIKRKYN